MAKNEKVEGPFRVPEVVLMGASDVNPAPYNPNVITPAKLQALKDGIRENGFVENLVVQRHSPRYGDMVLVGGHQRLKAVREVSIEDNRPTPKLPCVVLDIGDRAAKKLNIALNRIHGDPDARLLGELLEDIHHEVPISDEEILGMGFEKDDIAKYLKLGEPVTVPAGDGDSFARSATLSLQFTDIKMRDAVKAKLLEMSKTTEKSTGEVVFGLLEKRRKAS